MICGDENYLSSEYLSIFVSFEIDTLLLPLQKRLFLHMSPLGFHLKTCFDHQVDIFRKKKKLFPKEDDLVIDRRVEEFSQLMWPVGINFNAFINKSSYRKRSGGEICSEVTKCLENL